MLLFEGPMIESHGRYIAQPTGSKRLEEHSVSFIHMHVDIFVH